MLTRLVDARHDFVGHIGGDDFVLLMQSQDWEARCRSILAAFDAHIAACAHPDDLRQQGYLAENRRGKQEFHALPSLSIGALVVEPRLYPSHHEVSSALGCTKKEAKKIRGSALFVERRQPAMLPCQDAA